jgi:predicted RNA-binding Zn-ribbon protein involved in translation (DUF1610 family)
MAEQEGSTAEKPSSVGVPAQRRDAEEPAGAGRLFPCEACGAELEFHIGQQSLACPFCGHRKDLTFDLEARVEEQDLRGVLERLADRRVADSRQGEALDGEVRCEGCGAEVVFQGTLTSTTCPWCGRPVQREAVHRASEGIPVDGVLPFRVDRRRAHDALRRWVASRWLAPGEFKRYGVQGRFEGIYLPFWTFDALTHTAYRGERGEHYWVAVGSGQRRRRVRRTRWYPASGDFQRFFDDVLVSAGSGLPERQLQSLQPWSLERVVPFNSELLAGFQARTYDVPLAEGFGEARGWMERALQLETRRRIGGDVQRIHQLATRWEALTYKHLLLPVWLMGYRYGDRVYQVLVNADSAEVSGERPWSWVKIALLVLVLAVVLLILVHLGS